MSTQHGPAKRIDHEKESLVTRPVDWGRFNFGSSFKLIKSTLYSMPLSALFLRMANQYDSIRFWSVVRWSFNILTNRLILVLFPLCGWWYSKFVVSRFTLRCVPTYKGCSLFKISVISIDKSGFLAYSSPVSLLVNGRARHGSARVYGQLRTQQ